MDGSLAEGWKARQPTDPTDFVTEEDEIRGIEKGSLFPYLKNAGVLHCPADNVRRRPNDGSKLFASYAIPRCLNGLASGGGGMVKKFGRIKSPSQRFNFLETAEERNYNMAGSFTMYITIPGTGPRGADWQWWSPMAINHGDSSILGFTDGHAEPRKWSDEYTLEHTMKLRGVDYGLYNHYPPPPDQTDDIGFMAAGWTLE